MTIDIKSFTIEDLASWLENRPLGASFIDVREPSELEEQGTIKGFNANIPYFLSNTNPELFEKQFLAINKDEQVLNKFSFSEKKTYY
jgi:rhodanese-related sulfurtransferase